MKIWRDNQEAVALYSNGIKHFFNFISNGKLVMAPRSPLFVLFAKDAVLFVSHKNKSRSKRLVLKFKFDWLHIARKQLTKKIVNTLYELSLCYQGSCSWNIIARNCLCSLSIVNTNTVM